MMPRNYFLTISPFLQLHGYQLNMGNLLKEREEWSPRVEELQRSFSEAEQNLQREKALNSVALIGVKKQLAEASRALEMEKGCSQEVSGSLSLLFSFPALSLQFLSFFLVSPRFCICASWRRLCFLLFSSFLQSPLLSAHFSLFL